MRVIQVATSYDPAAGGPVQTSLSIHQAYLSGGNIVQTIGPGIPGTEWEPLSASGYKAYRPPWGPQFVLLFSPAMLLWLKRNVCKADLIHINFSRSAISIPAALIALAAKTPVVLQTHGMCQPWRGALSLVDRLLAWPILRRASLVYTLSEQESRELRDCVPTINLKVLYNAVIHADSLNQTMLVRNSNHPPRVLFCARLHPRKGLDTFLQVCAAVRERGYPLEATVVGPDEGARASAEQLAAQLNIPVDFRGTLDNREVLASMDESDILLHPAPMEPFGMSMLEAMSRDLPVIAAESSLLSPLFNRYEGAVLAPDTDIARWRDLVIVLLTSPEYVSRITANARQMLRDTFTVEVLREELWLPI